MLDKQSFIERVKKEVISKIIKNKSFIIAANWKMNKDTDSILEFINQLNRITWSNKNKVIICPPSPYLFLMKQFYKGSKIGYGVQNLHWEQSGAFTGEVSASIAKDFACNYAIIGHSERRNMFSESNNILLKKVKTSIDYGIMPILCIGENLEERDNNQYKERLKIQIVTGLSGLQIDEIKNVIIAYEPIWAIGTGINATPEQVEETHSYIRSILDQQYGESNSRLTPIIYGGSVKPHNVTELAIANNVSGFLIGGASLKIEEFEQIITKLNK